MASVNRVNLIGNLTREPERRVIDGGSVCVFGMAMNRKWKTDGGEEREDVCFVDVKAYGELAESFAGRKGECVYVWGWLRLEKWQDKDGDNHQRLIVVADRIEVMQDSDNYLPSKTEDTQQTQQRYSRPAASPTAEEGRASYDRARQYQRQTGQERYRGGDGGLGVSEPTRQPETRQNSNSKAEPAFDPNDDLDELRERFGE